MRGAKLSVIPRQTFSERQLALESFHLTPEETLEVNSVYRELSKVPAHFFESMAAGTNNVGVQYILIDYEELVLFLLDNKNLHPTIALSIIDRLCKIEPQMLTGPASIRFINKAGVALTQNSIVISDAKLFKHAWESSKMANHHGVVSKRFDSDSDGALLLSLLLTHSANAHNNSASMISMGTLLLILSYVNKLDEANIVSSLCFYRDELARVYDSEIKAWIAFNMPDHVGLPLSWVLEVVDLYI